jgi:hypothetical protein
MTATAHGRDEMIVGVLLINYLAASNSAMFALWGN